MKRLILAAVAAAALSAPAMAANCAKDYKDFWQSLDREKFAKMSAEQIADLSRTALRGYDACTAATSGSRPTISSSGFSRMRTQRPPTSSSPAAASTPPTRRRSKRLLTVDCSVGAANRGAHRYGGRSVDFR
jgi:hypothetical protein